MGVLPTSMCTTCLQCLRKPEEGIGILELKLQMPMCFHVGCELPCGCWGGNPGSEEQQQVLITTKPSL